LSTQVNMIVQPTCLSFQLASTFLPMSTVHYT